MQSVRTSLGNTARAFGVVALMLFALPQLTIAQTNEAPDEECDEASTPGLVVKAQNSWGAEGPRFTLTVQTSKDGVPKANVLFDNGENRLRDFEVHRVFLRGDHDHETTAADDHEGDHGTGLGVGIRGLGTLENGDKVRTQFDLWEVRGGREYEARIRWRDYDPDEVHEPGGGGGEGSCPGGGHQWTSTGWIQIQRVEIHQLHQR